ncbi:MAG: uroporphyrinogen decarboxylase family protein [Armatimonadia bacterium]
MPSPEMTSRERILAALHRQPVDYVPCSPWFNPLTEHQRVGRRWQFPWGPSERERCEYCVNILGVDPIVPCGLPATAPAPGVSSRVWYEKGLIHKVYTTPAGQFSSTIRYDDRWPHGLDIPFFSDFNPGHAAKFWIESEQDLECFGYIHRPSDRGASLDQTRFAVAEIKRRIADPLNLATWTSGGYGLTGALQVFGPTNLCLLAAEKPDLIHRYLEIDHAVNLRMIELALDFEIDIIGRNGFYETSDFYSPRMLEDFLFGKLQAEAALIHQGGAVETYTVNTGVMPMLDYLRRLDVDCLLSIDIAFNDLDLEALHTAMQGTKAFWTGPSSSYQLQEKDPEITRQAVRDCIRVFGHTGFILSPAPSAHSIMPWENVLAMIDEWKKLR